MSLITRITDNMNRRGIWARTNSDTGFRKNAPDGWVTENGPTWWYGSDASIPQADSPTNGLAAITKACSIIVNRIAVSLWSVGPEIVTDEEKVDLTGRTVPRWVADPMLVRPDDRYSATVWPAPLRLPAPLFWGQWIRSSLMWGMGWLIFAEDQRGFPWPGSMHVLNPFAVEANGLYFGERFYRTIVSPDGTRIPLDEENRFILNGERWRLLELKNPLTPLDTSTGLTPGNIQYHALELGLLPALANYSAGTFNGGGVPSGYIKVQNPQLSQGQADDLKSAWLKSHGGGRRSVAILTSTMDYTPISVSPVDAALVEMKKMSLVDVANAFCVPLFMLGAPAGHSNVYSNVETEQKALWIHTLTPWARAIESTLSTLLPVGTDLKISLPSLEGLPG